MTPSNSAPLDSAPSWLDQLGRERSAYCLPARANARAATFAESVLAFLFPHFAPVLEGARDGVEGDLEQLTRESQVLFDDFRSCLCSAPAHTGGRGPFVEMLRELREALLEDARFIVASDPAASSLDEVILAYPGFFATACYRLAHRVREFGVPLLPRLITEHAHQRTGIDIHPGAQIGVPFAIDHGTGIVIGETANVGVRVRMYQGVTLGALSVEKGLASSKRHPTIHDDVVLYANATVLGGRTVVGAGSVVGGNVWLTRSVAAQSVVVHKPMDTRISEEPSLAFQI